MMWKIEYYSDHVARLVFDLPSGHLARYLRYTEAMEKFGANLGMPHTRSLGEGLFELRITAAEGEARVLYCTQVRNRIIVLHAFVKKSQKAPVQELRLARQRMRKVKSP